MIEKDKLELVKSKQTGSVFMVIGQKDDLKCGCRFWVDRHAKAIIDVGFRFRVFQGDDSVPPLVFKDYVSARFPNATWSGVSTKHVSIAGSVKVSISPEDPEAVMGALTKNDTAGKILAFVLGQIGEFEFPFTEEEFKEFYYAEVQLALEAYSFPLTEGGSTAIVIDFGKYKQTFQDGFEVTAPQINPNDVTLSASGLGGGDGAGVTDSGVDDHPVDPVAGKSVGAVPATKGKITKTLKPTKATLTPPGEEQSL